MSKSVNCESRFRIAMTAATGKPPEGEKKGKDKEKKDLPPCKATFHLKEVLLLIEKLSGGG